MYLSSEVQKQNKQNKTHESSVCFGFHFLANCLSDSQFSEEEKLSSLEDIACYNILLSALRVTLLVFPLTKNILSS
jgi:hypothetical protein